MSKNLSKSKYCSAVQCPKMLWMKTFKPELFDNSVMKESVLETGNKVGDLAMNIFGDYTEVEYSEDLTKMLDDTKKLIENGTKVICEASFTFDGLFCAVDILKNNGNNEVEIYEVKSSTEIKDIYVHDVSYQNYVLENLGYHVTRICLVYINNEYVRHGELDLDQLFNIDDLTAEAKANYELVQENAAYFKKYLEQEDEPTMDIGEHCFKPYPCGFWGFCSRNLPQPNVFDIANMRKKFKLYKDGIVSYEQLEASNELNDKQRMQVEWELFDKPAFIDKQFVKEFLDGLSYPLYFLDFESYQSAIPPYDDSKPYEQIVFQYSLHYILEEGGELYHKEFLAYPGEDPRRKLAEQLCEDIPLNVCTTAYNMAFEKTRIKGLAEIYPDLADHLMNIHDHIQDLMIPFQKKMYYEKSMEGSYSIKYVLPALFPGDPALDYHNLEGVHNGGEASATFASMETMDKEELEMWRKNLLKYCCLDTYAMVKVWEKMIEVTTGEKLNY